MLKKGLRLKTEDFKVLPKTQRQTTLNFTIRTISTPNKQYLSDRVGCFAVVAPKKLYKKAVHRNQAKRLVYGVIEKALKNKQVFGQIFIFINKDILTRTENEILNELSCIFK